MADELRMALDELLRKAELERDADFLREGVPLNRKTVYRLLRRRGWFVHQRAATPRPRAQGRRSRTDTSDVRWEWT
jgi:hypothetical protein